jgi:hypothetical protein
VATAVAARGLGNSKKLAVNCQSYTENSTYMLYR